jgi:hypothetical protein
MTASGSGSAQRGDLSKHPVLWLLLMAALLVCAYVMLCEVTLWAFWLPLTIWGAVCCIYFLATNYYNPEGREPLANKDLLQMPFNVGFAIAAFMLPAIISLYEKAEHARPALLAAILLILIGIMACLWAIFSMSKLRVDAANMVAMKGRSFIKLRALALISLIGGILAFSMLFVGGEYHRLTVPPQAKGADAPPDRAPHSDKPDEGGQADG